MKTTMTDIEKARHLFNKILLMRKGNDYKSYYTDFSNNFVKDFYSEDIQEVGYVF